MKKTESSPEALSTEEEGELYEMSLKMEMGRVQTTWGPVSGVICQATGSNLMTCSVLST